MTRLDLRRRRMLRRVGGFDGVSFRFVAICDVLGFRSLSEANGTSWVEARQRELMADVRAASPRNADVHPFGDSIFMCTEPLPEPWIRADATPVALQENAVVREIDAFMAWVAHAARAGLRHDLPLRGGIAAGLCGGRGSEREILLGKPITDALSMERSQDWAGIALHESCFSWSGHTPDEGFRHVVRYAVPPTSRANAIGLKWALAWPLGPDGIDHEVQQLVADAAAACTGGPFEQRWRNTEEFIRHLETS